MNAAELMARLRATACERLPAPAQGATALRHRRLFEVAIEDVSLAKLAEAHWDAVAILEEARRTPAAGATYAVWASEAPGHALTWSDGKLNGTKRFCSGVGLVDRALITVRQPIELLLDVDLHAVASTTSIDHSDWASPAFAETRTGSITFHDAPVDAGSIVGEEHFYLNRPGFWHGAIGPAACWAGGAAGLMTYVKQSRKTDPHAMAHIGAIAAEIAGMEAILKDAGDAMDRDPLDREAAFTRALSVRHLVDSACSRVLDHFGRAFGPHPLAMDRGTSRRLSEVALFIRQCHAERDLQQLGEGIIRGTQVASPAILKDTLA